MLLAEATNREDDAMRERSCIVTREALPESQLIRFVVGPENELVPDLAAKLPGRGFWIRANRTTLERAVSKDLFSKAAKVSVHASADLPRRVEALLVSRIRDHLGIARRSGVLVLGFDGVVRALQAHRKPTVLIEARDGAEDGRRKVMGAVRAQHLQPAIIDVLTAAELAMALGRETVIHAALFPGPLADRLQLDAERLEGFRPRDAKRTGPSPVPDERRE
jgi:hypothetical protein